MELVSRAKAERLGYPLFYTGKACRRGHIDQRNTKHGYCMSCYEERKNSPETKQRNLQYYQENKERLNKYSKEYRENNLDYYKEYSSAYIKENAEILAQRQKEYYRENQEKLREKSRIYAKENPLKTRASKQRRRARLKECEGTHTDVDIQNLVTAQNNLCKYCEISFAVRKYHVDHIIPISKGGSNWPNNLQLLCYRCNIKKGSKMPEDLDGKFFASLKE